MTMPLALAASASAFIGVFLVALSFLRGRGTISRTRQRLDAIEAYGRSRRARAVPLALRERGSAWVERTLAELDRAGLALRIQEYLTLRLFLALVGFLVVILLVGLQPLSFLLALGLGALGFMIPAFYVRSRINRQVQKFNAQLEEMINMVSSSLRAGLGLTQSLSLAAEQLQPPIATELRRLIRDINMGATLEDAVKAWGERIRSAELDVIVTAILIQRSVGSNLSEVLDNVAHTIRERARIRGEINTLTAQKRLSGWIVGMMPPLFVVLMFTINFDYMKPLFTTGLGHVLIILAAVLDVIGLLIIRRIVSLEL